MINPAFTKPTLDRRRIQELRSIAFRSLQAMYSPAMKAHVHSLRLVNNDLVQCGLSGRYTSITLLGLAKEGKQDVSRALHGESLEVVADSAAILALNDTNIGDVALALWASHVVGGTRVDELRARLVASRVLSRVCPTVELSWVLAAATVDRQLLNDGFAKQVADRLLTAFNKQSGVFSTSTGGNTSRIRAHVSCFADFVYPIQSLSMFHCATGDKAALAAAAACGAVACKLQGSHGQWWWHYDRRHGTVIEPFPVYTVHQHGMGPMAMQALAAAGGGDYSDAVARSINWLYEHPERSPAVIDFERGVIWRKVARQEPHKLARRIRAVATLVRPTARVAGLDRLLPATAVDFECRPYELGWLLFAWPPEQALEEGNRTQDVR